MHTKSLRDHPLWGVIRRNKGNPRTLIFMEPLWGIPFNLIAPFATLYMYTQGVTDVQIGLILSVAMIVQVFFSFFGGILTDKLGRKFTTMMGDFFGWSLACLIWAISDNFWLFFLAMLFNCFEQINQTAWFCLLIEDAQPKDLVGLYSWVNICGLIAIFFAPLSGLLIRRFTLVPVMRVLYLIFSVNMLIKVLVTWKYCSETRQGKVRLEETKNISVFQMLAEYRKLIPRMLKNGDILRVIALSVILYITNLFSGNFFGLYVTQRLGIPESFLALFPILNAAVMLFFMVVIQHRMDAVKFRTPLWSGLILHATATVLLLLAPEGNLIFILLYVFATAVAGALIAPRKDALLQLNIDPQERARINALIMAFTIALSSPFGYFAGWLSSLDRRLPFLFSLLLFVAAMVIVGRIREPEFEESSDPT